MKLELRRLHGGLVTRRRTLASLLKEARPACETQDGDPYFFDRRVLEAFAAVLSAEECARLKLPILLRFTTTVPDQCSVDSETAAAAIKRLEGIEKAYPFRDGRMWVPHSLAMEWVRRYPTAIQVTFIP